MSLHGIDVSSYQPSDYSTAGLSFVFVKCTEGITYENPKYAAQVARARSASLVVGHYHFGHPGDTVGQAEYFLAHADLHAGDLVAYDWEASGTSQADRDAWIHYVKDRLPGHKVVLYCNRNFWTQVDTESYAGDGLWIADPDAPAGRPNISHAWAFHQYSSASGLDRDVANFASVDALRTWAGIPGPRAPKPVVSLSNLVAAARTDPGAPQGHQTHPADVRIVEPCLVAEGLLADEWAHDGSFGGETVTAYGKWQERCGYHGIAANGIPGHDSLLRLGERHNFAVGA